MKFLFVLSHGLYLRHYGDFVEEMIARGHEIRILRTSEKEVDDSRLIRFSTDYPGILLAESCQLPRGGHWDILDPLRAVRDYLRYFEPVYARSTTLFERSARRMPRPIRHLMEARGWGAWGWLRGKLDGVLQLIEKAYSPDPAVVALLKREAPDAVLLTPLIDFDYRQLDVLKAAASLGLRSTLMVASWDNLTNKGRILIPCERVLVWNEFQKQEAINLHQVEPSRIAVTGAQTFDHWFSMAPRRTRAEFCAEVGFRSDGPFLLYVGSSAFVCPNEGQYILEWLQALRSCQEENMRDMPVMIRPHPTNDIGEHASAILESGSVVIWPRVGTVPMDTERQEDYFESLFFSAALVGINTSSFLEAGIVGRRSFALPQPSLGPSQYGTLHFRYLARSDYLATASSWDEHLNQLSQHMLASDPESAVNRGFLEAFIRPHGMRNPALPYLVEAVEEGVRQPAPLPSGTPRWGWLVRGLLRIPGRWIASGYRARVLARANSGKGSDREDRRS